MNFNNQNYNSFRLYIGPKNNEENVFSDFEVSMSRSNILIGQHAKAGWGINCGADQEDSNTSCQYDSVI